MSCRVAPVFLFALDAAENSPMIAGFWRCYNVSAARPAPEFNRFRAVIRNVDARFYQPFSNRFGRYPVFNRQFIQTASALIICDKFSVVNLSFHFSFFFFADCNEYSILRQLSSCQSLQLQLTPDILDCYKQHATARIAPSLPIPIDSRYKPTAVCRKPGIF